MKCVFFVFFVFVFAGGFALSNGRIKVKRLQHSERARAVASGQAVRADGWSAGMRARNARCVLVGTEGGVRVADGVAFPDADERFGGVVSFHNRGEGCAPDSAFWMKCRFLCQGRLR